MTMSHATTPVLRIKSFSSPGHVYIWSRILDVFLIGRCLRFLNNGDSVGKHIITALKRMVLRRPPAYTHDRPPIRIRKLGY